MFGAMLAIMLAAQTSAANPMVADPERLHRIDTSFRCPESLASEKEKVEAIAKFDHDVSLAVKDLTVTRLSEIRIYLLRKHGCTTTLQNIARNSAAE